VLSGAYPLIVAPTALERTSRLRRLRPALIALLIVWFFSPPSVRDAVPLWAPFLLAVVLEAHFVLTSWRSKAPIVPSAGRVPSVEDRLRYGDGTLPEWAIVEEEGERVWIDLSEQDEVVSAELPARTPPTTRQRHIARSLVEALAVLALVAALLVLFDRGSWGDLDPQTQLATEARISAEASRVAGKPVRVGCDTSGRYVGFVRHADGVAAVGGVRAYLTPELCYALHRLAADGDVPSFSQTARAIAVLAHEAWHLRGVGNEGVTECFALQSGVRVGQRLGLDDGTARRMMRSQLVANQLHRQGSFEYVVPPECANRGRYDLNPRVDVFP
jgi:hypothetical protein